MPTQLTILGEGVLASVLVAGQVTCWVALGSPLATRLERDELRVPVSLLAGAATTSLAYALLTWSGHVSTAIAVGLALSLAAGAFRGKRAARLLWRLGGVYREVLGSRRLPAVVSWIVLVGGWVLAISPPRDADVMRYHLAHIRQIVSDGRWQAIPDYHYALPFGWSLNFLPFERAGLAVGANLLSLALTLTTVAVLLRVTRGLGATRTVVIVLGLALVLQPMSLKMATTAHADAYAILVSATVVALLLALGTPGAAASLGFAAVVGLQSRYQAAAIAIAAAAAFVLAVLRGRAPARSAVGFAAGGLAGLAAAWPFYVVNWRAFGDPFWPLFAGSATYADRVVTAYSRGLDGTLTAATLAHGVRALLHDSSVFPVPLLVVIALGALAFTPGARRRLPGLLPFLVVFLAAWGATQPNLYSRFVLLVAPAVVVVVAVAAEPLAARLPGAAVAAVAVLLLAPLFAFGAAYMRDSARLVVTGDLSAYHRYTWYYPVWTWLDGHAPSSSRGLVIVDSGQTYYLDRRYRRADPFLTGTVDWEAVKGAAGLQRTLRRGGYDYVVYDARDWSTYPGGAQMEATLRSARAAGVLHEVRRFDVELSVGRVRRAFTPATVLVYSVRGAAHPLVVSARS